jgi:hypothetical protein
MITFKQYIAEQEDKATSGFDKDKNGNVFIAHDTSFERKKEREKKKDTNESIIKKVKKAFGVKADHEKSLAEHAAGHNKEDHSEHLSSHSADAHKDPHERKAFDHFKHNSTKINEHLIDNHKSSLGHRYGKKHADEHKEKNKKHVHQDDFLLRTPNRKERQDIHNSEAHVHHSILKHSKPLKKKITLYHGSAHDFGKAAMNSKDGTIHSPAHMSTSHDHKSAINFGSGHVVAIHASKKTKAVHVDGKGSMTHNDPEKETIIPAGTKLKHIKSHKTKDGYTLHHFKVHSQEHPYTWHDDHAISHGK